LVDEVVVYADVSQTASHGARTDRQAQDRDEEDQPE
jgi:hypothetical protein